MPYKYDYDEIANLVTTKIGLRLDSPIALKYFKDLHEDHRLQPGFVDVFYIDGVKHFELTTDEMFSHQITIQAINHHRGYAGSVMVCQGALSYGIARTYKGILAQVGIPVEVVRTEGDIPAAIRLVRAAQKQMQMIA
jgi:hypothetical protein